MSEDWPDKLETVEYVVVFKAGDEIVNDGTRLYLRRLVNDQHVQIEVRERPENERG